MLKAEDIETTVETDPETGRRVLKVCLAKRVEVPDDTDYVSELESEYQAAAAMRALYGFIRDQVTQIDDELTRWLDSASDLEEARINLRTARCDLNWLKSELQKRVVFKSTSTV